MPESLPPEQELVLRCARAAAERDARAAELVGKVCDWKAVVAWASLHGVIPAIHRVLGPGDMPESVWLELGGSALASGAGVLPIPLGTRMDLGESGNRTVCRPASRLPAPRHPHGGVVRPRRQAPLAAAELAVRH